MHRTIGSNTKTALYCKIIRWCGSPASWCIVEDHGISDCSHLCERLTLLTVSTFATVCPQISSRTFSHYLLELDRVFAGTLARLRLMYGFHWLSTIPSAVEVDQRRKPIKMRSTPLYGEHHGTGFTAFGDPFRTRLCLSLGLRFQGLAGLSSLDVDVATVSTATVNYATHGPSCRNVTIIATNSVCLNVPSFTDMETAIRPCS